MQTPKWTNFKEFVQGKTITPLSVKRLCGDQTKSKFKDKDGCVFHMEYLDHDNGDIIRWYDTPFPSFEKTIVDNQVKGRHKYKVRCAKNGPHWKWEWQLLEEEPLQSSTGTILS